MTSRNACIAPKEPRKPFVRLLRLVKKTSLWSLKIRTASAPQLAPHNANPPCDVSSSSAESPATDAVNESSSTTSHLSPISSLLSQESSAVQCRIDKRRSFRDIFWSAAPSNVFRKEDDERYASETVAFMPPIFQRPSARVPSAYFAPPLRSSPSLRKREQEFLDAVTERLLQCFPDAIIESPVSSTPPAPVASTPSPGSYTHSNPISTSRKMSSAASRSLRRRRSAIQIVSEYIKPPPMPATSSQRVH